MKRTRWAFVAAVVAGVVVLVAPAVGQGKAKRASLAWSRSRGGAAITSFDFGAVDDGSSVSRWFRLRSSSLTKSGDLGITVTGSPAFSIASDKCTFKSIGRGLSCWVAVAYAPLGGTTSARANLWAGGDYATANLRLSGSNAGGPSGHVYFAGIGYNQAVQAVPRGGGSATTIASDNDYPYVNDPVSLAADGRYVYWVNGDGTVNKVPLAGGKVTTLASGQDQPSAVAVDGTNVYWVTWDQQGTVEKVPIGGGPVTTLATGQSWPASVAVEGTRVYWVNGDGTVNEVPVGGGSVTTLATGPPNAVSMAVDSTHVYWGTFGTVNEVPLGGGSVTTLATGQNFPIGMAVDGTHVYWVNHGGGEVNKVPISGGSVTTLAQFQYDADAMAVDGTHVYWVNGDGGQVNKVPIGGGRVITLATSTWPQAIAIGP
jgi:hypothetical protein